MLRGLTDSAEPHSTWPSCVPARVWNAWAWACCGYHCVMAMQTRTAWAIALAVWVALGIGTTVFLHYHLHRGGGIAHHTAVRQAVAVGTSGLRCPEPPPCPACSAPGQSTPCKSTAANAIITARPCPTLHADGEHPCSKRSAKIRAGYTKGVTQHVSGLKIRTHPHARAVNAKRHSCTRG